MPAAPPETTLVVINPASAGGRTLKRWPKVRAALRAAGVPLRAQLTSAPGDATAIVRRQIAEGMRRIVAVGGDGTLNEVVNGCFGRDGRPLAEDLTVALVPSGTGGDFRRTLDLPRDPAALAAMLALGRSRPVDVGRVEFGDGAVRHFINIADCGIGGEVVRRVNRSPLKGGGMRGTAVFLGASLTELWTFGGRDAVIEADGERIERRVQQVVIANGRYFGGGMLVAPEAEMDDGLFDVIIVGEMARGEALRAIPSLYRGKHLGHPKIETRRAREVRISASAGGPELLFDLEGEQVGATPATLTCLAGALRVCVP